MSCESKFTADVSLSCILGLVADIRKGVTTATVTQALWIAGCLVTKLSPPDKAGINPEVGTLSCASLDELLDALECACHDMESVSVSAASPTVGTQGWEVFIPLILELVKFIIENRKKKQQPAPQPGA